MGGRRGNTCPMSSVGVIRYYRRIESVSNNAASWPRGGGQFPAARCQNIPTNPSVALLTPLFATHTSQPQSRHGRCSYSENPCFDTHYCRALALSLSLLTNTGAGFRSHLLVAPPRYLLTLLFSSPYTCFSLSPEELCIRHFQIVFATPWRATSSSTTAWNL